MSEIQVNASVSDLLLRRDQQSIETLIDLYRPLMRSLAERCLRSSLRSHLDASDIVQETCVEVARSISNLRTTRRSQFLGYLRVIVLNKVRDAHRHFVLCEKRSINRESVSLSKHLHWKEWAQRVESEPLQRLVEDETCQRVVELVQRLPRELQSIIHMRFTEDMTYRTISNCVGRSEDGVRTLILRCLDRIRLEVTSDESRQ